MRNSFDRITTLSSFLITAVIVITLLPSCDNMATKTTEISFTQSDADSIQLTSDRYVQAWLDSDTLGVLNNFTKDAVIMPAGMEPKEGWKEMKKFWWPDDGSKTVINEYTMNIHEISGNDSLAFSRGTGELSFTYEKDSQISEHLNTSMSLTVYKLQPSGEWKIIRRMWGPINR